MSHELWCAEGFTQYYGLLLMVRAGLLPESDYLAVLTDLINRKLNTPGATLYTPMHSSNMAVFTDAGVSVDKTNYPNIFTSYYFYGASLALALDLTLRSKFNKTLDHFMQQMWKQHGKTETSYTVADMQKALAEVTNSGFAKSFFDDYVYGHGSPDYAALLRNAGLHVQVERPGAAWIGSPAFTENNGLAIASNTIRNTPLYDAGLDVNDIIFSVNNQKINSSADLSKELASHKPGEKLSLSFLHRNEKKEATILLKENPRVIVTSLENIGGRLTEQTIHFRKQWLGRQ
jgi:predicted metalloprotease with PDZ domain